MNKEFNGITVECIQGNIADQPEMEAIVNAANAQLRTGGGVAGAIHSAAGSGLPKETRPLAPISPGEAVITSAHDLPNTYVIHCLGPVYGQDEPSDELLADCYRNAFRRAIEHDVESIVFPAISTGAFGYPLEEATEIALRTVRAFLAEAGTIRQVRFVLFSEEDLAAYERTLGEIF